MTVFAVAVDPMLVARPQRDDSGGIATLRLPHADRAAEGCPARPPAPSGSDAERVIVDDDDRLFALPRVADGLLAVTQPPVTRSYAGASSNHMLTPASHRGART